MKIIDSIRKQIKIHPSKLDKIIKLSTNGDSKSTISLIEHYMNEYKTINHEVMKYIDLAIEQKEYDLARWVAVCFEIGISDPLLNIEKSEDLQFKYSLYDKEFKHFPKLLDLAKPDPIRQKQLISAGRSDQLNFICNKIIKELSPILDNDLSLFKYICLLTEIYGYFEKEKDNRFVESNALKRTDRVTHYTTIQAIHSMLRLPDDVKQIDDFKKKYPVFRLYNAAYMNDPEEGLYLFDTKSLAGIVPYIDDERHFQKYLTSFTAHKIDDLTMWRLYGRDGTGISIVLPSTDLKTIMSMLFSNLIKSPISNQIDLDIERKTIQLYKVSYDCTEIREKIAEYLSDLKTTITENNDSENEQLVKYLYQFFAECCDEIRYLFKNPQYEVEKEYRYLSSHKLDSDSVKLDEREIPYLYIEALPNLFKEGTEIIIGPKAVNPIALKLDIEYRLKKYGFEKVKVSISQAKYK